jgi:hypothetical protein
VATIAPGHASLASFGSISGIGLAIAKMIGFFAILATSYFLRAPPTDTPIKQSAPTNASDSVLSGLSVAN